MNAVIDRLYGLVAESVLDRRSERYQRMARGFCFAFPGEDDATVDRRVRAAIRALFSTTRDAQRFLDLPTEAKRRYVAGSVRLAGSENLEDALASGRPIVTVTPHFGNLYVTLAALSHALRGRRRVAVLHDPLEKHPGIADTERIVREFGYEGIPADKHCTVRATRWLRTGAILCMLPDIYDISPSAVFVPFFGGLALAMPGSAYFARATDAIVLPVSGYPDRGKHTVAFDPGFSVERTHDRERDLFDGTSRIFAVIEERIRANYAMWGYWEFLCDRVAHGFAIPTDGRWAQRLYDVLQLCEFDVPTSVARSLDALRSAGDDLPATSTTI